MVEKETDAVKDVEKVEKKALYNVLLEKFDAAAKAKIIREVKIIMPKLNLVEVDHFFMCVGEGIGGKRPKGSR
jgi:large subunit ribosomal protein L7/L12